MCLDWFRNADDILNILTILYINIYAYSKNKSLFSFKSKKYFKGRLTATFWQNTADKYKWPHI